MILFLINNSTYQDTFLDFPDLEPFCFDEKLVNKFEVDFNSKSYEDTSESFEKLAVNFHGITEDDLVMKQIFRQGSGPIVPPASSVVGLYHFNELFAFLDKIAYYY